MALAGALLSALAAVVAADVFSVVPALRVAQARSVIAAVLLGAVAYLLGKGSHGGNLGMLAVFGANLAAVTIFFYWSIERLGVGPGTTIQFTAAVLVLVWMRVVEQRPVAPIAWTAAAGAVAGTAMMTRAWSSDLDLVGLTAGVASAFTFASYLVLGEKLGARLPALTINAYGFAFSALIWLVAVPPRVGDLTLASASQLVFIGILGTAVPFLLITSAVHRADPGSVGVVATAEPVIGAAVAWVALSQVLTPVQVVGGAVTAVSVAAIQFLAERRGRVAVI